MSADKLPAPGKGALTRFFFLINWGDGLYLYPLFISSVTPCVGANKAVYRRFNYETAIYI